MGAISATAKKISAVSDLIRLPKQYGTLLVLWPTMWSLFIASGGAPSLKLLVIFVLGTFLMRSAGCAINDIADRGFDPHVRRTSSRPLADGRLNVKEAVFVFIALSTLAFSLALQLNRLTIALSFVGILLASVYPFVKRVSHFPQAFLGAAFGWGAVMSWAASTGTVGLVSILIFIANIFWSMAYDTIYALMDIEDDLRIGVKSTAIYFGKSVYPALHVMYLAFASFMAAAGIFAGLGPVYFIGLILSLFSFFLIVREVRKGTGREAAFNGFLANAAVGAGLLLFIILDLITRHAG